MPSLNTGNAILSNAIAVNSSYNVGIGGAASGSFKLQVTGNVNADNFIIQPTGYGLLASLSRDLTGSGFGVLNLKNGSNGFIQPAALSVDRTYTLPDATGTIALTSNLSAYLPLTGGTLTGALNGTSATFSSSVTANRYIINGTNGNSGQIIQQGDLLGTVGTNLLFQSSAGNGIGFLTNGSTTFNMFINSFGNVLIGSTSDNGTGKLQVTNNQAGWGGQITNNNGQQVLFAHNGGFGLNVNAGSNASSSTYLATFVSNGIDRFYITGNGNVGIGTSSPTGTYGKLSVAGGISILNDNNAKLEIGRYSSGVSNSYIKLGANSNSLNITNNTDTVDLFTIQNGGDVIMRFNAFVGNTSSSSNAIIQFQNSANSYQFGFASSGTQRFTFINGAPTEVGYLTGAGVFYSSGGGTSDARMKQNIEYIDSALDNILKLKPATFEFISNPENKRGGFIAQDVLEVIPDLVLGDGQLEGGTYGLDYDGILALAVKAIQELNQKINEQQQTINSLINR
jgi:hypothetical protein